MSEEHISNEDYLKSLELLYKKGSDGFGQLSSGLITALGAAGAYAAAPAIATLIGATTTTVTVGSVLGSTTLSLLGVGGTVAAVSNPIGWVVGGITLAGALTAYGLSKLCLKSGHENAKRDRYKEDLRKKILGYMATPKKTTDNDKVKMVADALITAYKQGKVSKEDGSKLVMLLKEKKITPEAALSTLLKMIGGK